MYSNYSTKCGKLFFLDQYDADLKIIEREADDGTWLGRSYECPKCKRWHIATLNKADEKVLAEELLKIEAKRQRNLEIIEEKRAKEEFDKRLAKIKKESSELRKMAAKNLNSNLSKQQANRGTTKSAPRIKDENRVVESFGNSSNNSVLNNIDAETLAKLKEKL